MQNRAITSLGFRLAVILTFGLGLSPAGIAQSAAKKIFALQDDEHQQWCAFTTESAWKSRVDALSAIRVATVEYLDDRPSTISITEEDEAGDWIVYDRYSLDRRGAIQKLSRTTNVLPGDRSVTEEFLIRNGKANKQATTYKSLSTGTAAVGPGTARLPDVPVLTSVQPFPLVSLLEKGRSELLAKGTVCAQIKGL